MRLSDYLTGFPPGRYGALLAENIAGHVGKLLPAIGNVDIDQYILECVLSSPGVGGDFSIQITRARLSAFLEIFNRDVLREWCSRSSVWRRTYELCRCWDSDPLFTNISDIWLEFDYEMFEQEIPLPCVFFGARRISIGDALRGPVGILLGGIPGKDTSIQLMRCVSALPGSGLFQLGVMLGREENSHLVRLFTNDLKSDKIMPFLNQVGWGSSEEHAILGEFIKWTEEYSDGLYILDFDVSTNGPADKLGVCFAPPPGIQPLVDFFDALQGRGWGLPEKLADVTKWVGHRDFPSLANSISHFKFSFEGDFKSAKIYLRSEAATYQTMLINSKW